MRGPNGTTRGAGGLIAASFNLMPVGREGEKVGCEGKYEKAEGNSPEVQEKYQSKNIGEGRKTSTTPWVMLN